MNSADETKSSLQKESQNSTAVTSSRMYCHRKANHTSRDSLLAPLSIIWALASKWYTLMLRQKETSVMGIMQSQYILSRLVTEAPTSKLSLLSCPRAAVSPSTYILQYQYILIRLLQLLLVVPTNWKHNRKGGNL